MRSIKCNFKQRYHLVTILILIVFVNVLFFSPLFNNMTVEGKSNQYRIEEFKEEIHIEKNNFIAIDINFQKGKNLEVVFLLQVKNDIPIDIWFVNEDNYLLLSGGAQFLYFMDGTAQKVSYAKKIVTLTEHDNYKLVLTNYYANQTVEVDIAGEIRTYGLESNEKSSENSFETFLFYPFLTAIIILAVLTIFLFVKTHKSRRGSSNDSKKKSTNNSKDKKKNKSKQKIKDKTPSKKSRSKKSKQSKPEITLTTLSKKSKSKATSASNGFCGHCGYPVETPYCTKCGEVVETTLLTIKNNS